MCKCCSGKLVSLFQGDLEHVMKVKASIGGVEEGRRAFRRACALLFGEKFERFI